MELKMIEIRDSATFIPAMAIRLLPGCEEDRALLARAGYGREPERQGEYVLLSKLVGDDTEIHYDPHAWNLHKGRTMTIAHLFIRDNFARLESGMVVDVEFILGEKAAEKDPEVGRPGCGLRLPEEIAAGIRRVA